MSRRKTTPSYVPHKQSGRARTLWTDTAGIRHQKLLSGLSDSPESLAEFARLQLELTTSPSASMTDPISISVNEMLVVGALPRRGR